jgi:hypothetical protein
MSDPLAVLKLLIVNVDTHVTFGIIELHSELDRLRLSTWVDLHH